MMNPILNRLSAAYTTWSILYQTQKYLLRARRYPTTITKLKLCWAQTILKIIKLDLKVINSPVETTGLILVGNHISYLDIPVLLATCKDISFVSKAEIRSWPLIGTAAKLLGTVFVERDKKKSRHLAKETISEELKNHKRIVIFPSGTTCETESKPWRQGAFQIAFDNKIKVLPFRISYYPLRRAAYIGNDSFLTHLFLLLKHGKISATIEFHEPVTINNVESDSKGWQIWSKGLLNEVRH
jgi:lyso-ornithine lipid O-acyltransferase